MEDQLAHLLAETQSSQETPRRQAELRLKQLYPEHDFPLGLISLASNTSVPLNIRQAALLVCGKFVETSWSPNLDDFTGTVLVNDDDKAKLRDALFNLATSEHDERRAKSAASLVVSKIAAADFPDEWPDLLPNLLHMIPEASDGRLHGALKVLQDLVDDCLGEEQFFKVARDLVSTVYQVATNESRRPNLRALAVSVFRSSFDTLEMIMESHKAAVKGFAEEALYGWNPFFQNVIKTPLPPAPSEDDEDEDTTASEYYRGTVALKLQIIKVLMRIRTVFPAVLAPQSLAYFSAVWEELNHLTSDYTSLYINDDRQGRLEDADGLPYTLDFLVLEELDFIKMCLRAPQVKKELEKQLNSEATSGWIAEMTKLLVTYAHITTEEEGLWEIDVNIYLAEESSVTANYTPRTACAEVAVRLSEWLQGPTVDALQAFSKHVTASDRSWKSKEATLYLLNVVLRDMQEVDKHVPQGQATAFIDFVSHSMEQSEVFLRARGHLVAGSLIKTSGGALFDTAHTFLRGCLSSIINDQSDIVKVSCVQALQQYLSALPPTTTTPLQSDIIATLAHFLSQQDLNDLSESEDVMVALLETLRDAILLDTRICLEGTGLDLLFTIASHGAGNFQLAMLITETFEEVASTLSATGPETFAQFCAKVLPSLTGAFDVASMTEENALTNLAADMLAVLSENGSSPLPQGFVYTVMPKLERLLLGSNEDELLRAGTNAIKSMLEHDPEQMFAWHNSEGKSGLEVLLVIIDRLLNGGLDDNAASEVGGLAGALVEKAGSERLGPFLPQLLNAVAVRLAAADKTQIIQSLVLVFARLMIISPREVVDFLANIQIGSESGLQVVLPKWLENSVHFAGYDEIRQNATALAALYDLHSPYLPAISVRGDQIVNPQTSSRIITRSRAKLEPTQYTSVPADLKVIKVLVNELLDASGGNAALEPKSAVSAAAGGDGVLDGGDGDDGDEEDADGEWEDDPNDFLDLGSGMTKESLMAFGEGTGRDLGRGRDDETQAFLLGWFRETAGKPGFEEMFGRLNEVEQERLRGWLG